MSGIEAAHDIQICSIKPGLKYVLAIERKVVTDSGAPDRSQGQTFDVLVLRQILPNTIGFAARAEPLVAHS